MKTPLDCIHDALKTYEARQKTYGDNYTRHGRVMKAMFPLGVHLHSEHNFNRFGVFNMLVAKLTRYAENWDSGGHQDSIHDLGVYAFILEAIDEQPTEGGER